MEMKLQYLNGARISPLPHEMSALDIAMYNYDKALQKHKRMAKYHLSETNKNSPLTKSERAVELAASLAFLENERRHLENIAQVKAGLQELEEYRKTGMLAVKGSNRQKRSTINMMEDEEHHPTDTLEKLMRAEGVPKPSPEHTAHHILPGSGQYEQRQIARARTHMHLKGIRINDPANGVYLLTKDDYTPHWSMPKSRGHLTYHTREYEVLVSQRVRRHTTMDFIKTELQVIGGLLQQNDHQNSINKIKQR